MRFRERTEVDSNGTLGPEPSINFISYSTNRSISKGFAGGVVSKSRGYRHEDTELSL